MTRPIRLKHRLAAVLLALFLVAASSAAGADGFDSYVLTTSVTLTNRGETHCHWARIQTPLVYPVGPYGQVVKEEFSIEPDSIFVNEDGTRVGTFYMTDLAPGQSVTLVIIYTFAPGLPGEAFAGNVDEPRVDVDSERLTAVAQDLVTGKQSDREQAVALLTFVREHMTYDADSPWRNSDALTALATGSGVCEDYAMLLVALARAVGLDSRVAYGYRGSAEQAFERHAWTELMIDGEWIAVDPVTNSDLALHKGSTYLLQWYRDINTRISFAGGRLAGGLTETVGVR